MRITEELIKKIHETFIGTRETYINTFKYYYPSHGGNGFTERNQTFNFSHNYLKNGYNAVVWQELPVKYNKKKGHLDMLIIDNELKVVLFLEAKRISKNQISSNFTSVKKDMSRLCAHDLIESIPRGKLIEDYQHYILYLADTWYNPNEKVIDPRKNLFDNWCNADEYSEWIPENSKIIEINCGKYPIGKPSDNKTGVYYKKENTEQYNIMYRLYSREIDTTLRPVN